MTMYRECLTVDERGERSILENMPPSRSLCGIARFFAVFSDETRLKILSALSMKDLCVADLCFFLTSEQSTVSHQLRLLKDAGIVASRKAGRLTLYTIVDPYVSEVMLTGARRLRRR